MKTAREVAHQILRQSAVGCVVHDFGPDDEHDEECNEATAAITARDTEYTASQGTVAQELAAAQKPMDADTRAAIYGDVSGLYADAKPASRGTGEREAVAMLAPLPDSGPKNFAPGQVYLSVLGGGEDVTIFRIVGPLTGQVCDWKAENIAATHSRAPFVQLDADSDRARHAVLLAASPIPVPDEVVRLRTALEKVREHDPHRRGQLLCADCLRSPSIGHNERCLFTVVSASLDAGKEGT